MTPTNITAKNAAAITAKLAAVNGRATTHAFTEYDHIAYVAALAEKAAHALLGSQKAIVGATWTETSGEKVCNAYARTGYWRAATRITMTRRPSSWFLTEVERVETVVDPIHRTSEVAELLRLGCSGQGEPSRSERRARRGTEEIVVGDVGHRCPAFVQQLADLGVELGSGALAEFGRERLGKEIVGEAIVAAVARALLDEFRRQGPFEMVGELVVGSAGELGKDRLVNVGVAQGGCGHDVERGLGERVESPKHDVANGVGCSERLTAPFAEQLGDEQRITSGVNGETPDVGWIGVDVGDGPNDPGDVGLGQTIE